jgi:hypothetical protein
MTVKSSLTVLFEEPFWIGVYERVDGKYKACKITFGSEPKDYEVYDLLLHGRGRLRFSPPVSAEKAEKKHINPKRMQREISGRMRAGGIGTKAQQALKLQHEQAKEERKTFGRERREAAKERKYAARQQKKKEKHRGR